MTSDSRILGAYTSPEVAARIGADSILCLPLGAIEQHGPHLPLNTDCIIAEAFCQRLIARYGAAFDLWQLPLIALGLSREHAWAAGTLSFSTQTFLHMLHDLGREITRSVKARRLVIVNGHGGNRGMLGALIYDLRQDHGLNVCVLNPLVLSGAEEEADYPDIHGGRIETSIMLAVAPHLVRRENATDLGTSADTEAIGEIILDRGVNWPWSSGDPRIADRGVTGDAGAADAAFGEQVLDRAIERARFALQRLKEEAVI